MHALQLAATGPAARVPANPYAAACPDHWPTAIHDHGGQNAVGGRATKRPASTSTRVRCRATSCGTLATTTRCTAGRTRSTRSPAIPSSCTATGSSPRAPAARTASTSSTCEHAAPPAATMHAPRPGLVVTSPPPSLAWRLCYLHGLPSCAGVLPAQVFRQHPLPDQSRRPRC